MSYYGDDCDLNTIDVSKIQDFSELFSEHGKLWKFNGDIFRWDVLKVTNNRNMFYRCPLGRHPENNQNLIFNFYKKQSTVYYFQIN